MNVNPQMGADNGAAAAAAAKQQAERKDSLISQFLEQNAIVRLNNLAAAKPEKARMVETMIMNMIQRGQIAGKMSDDGLKQLLERISQQTEKATTVKFDRRRNRLSDSDED